MAAMAVWPGAKSLRWLIMALNTGGTSASVSRSCRCQHKGTVIGGAQVLVQRPGWGGGKGACRHVRQGVAAPAHDNHAVLLNALLHGSASADHAFTRAGAAVDVMLRPQSRMHRSMSAVNLRRVTAAAWRAAALLPQRRVGVVDNLKHARLRHDDSIILPMRGR